MKEFSIKKYSMTGRFWSETIFDTDEESSAAYRAELEEGKRNLPEDIGFILCRYHGETLLEEEKVARII